MNQRPSSKFIAVWVLHSRSDTGFLVSTPCYNSVVGDLGTAVYPGKKDVGIKVGASLELKKDPQQ